MKMNSSLLYFLTIPALLVLFSFVHDYHVSIYEIDYNQDRKALEIGGKIFIDDLNRVLLKSGVIEESIDQENEAEKINPLIANYITSHFKLYNQEDKLTLEFVGVEWEDHHTLWCYFEVTDIQEITELKVTNRVFIDEFDAQQNIHHFKINNIKKSLVLTKNIKASVLNFSTDK